MMTPIRPEDESEADTDPPPRPAPDRRKSPMEDPGSPGGTAGTGGTDYEQDD